MSDQDDIREQIITGYLQGKEEGEAIGLQKGREEGREEGSKAKAVEIARTMLADGVPPDTVARYTHLPIEEVTRLRSK